MYRGRVVISCARAAVSEQTDPPADPVAARRRHRYPGPHPERGAHRAVGAAGRRRQSRRRERADRRGRGRRKRTPDGYTLFFTYGGVLTTGLPLFRKLPYDPIADFAPVAMMAHVPGVLVAHPSFPAKTVAELIKLAKAKPGALTHGASSIGSQLASQHGALQADGGHRHAAWCRIPATRPRSWRCWAGTCRSRSTTSSPLPHIQSGKLRPIAVATAQRVPNLPDVPTIAESGLPGYEGLAFLPARRAREDAARDRQQAERGRDADQADAGGEAAVRDARRDSDRHDAARSSARFLQRELDKVDQSHTGGEHSSRIEARTRMTMDIGTFLLMQSPSARSVGGDLRARHRAGAGRRNAGLSQRLAGRASLLDLRLSLAPAAARDATSRRRRRGCASARRSSWCRCTIRC